MIRKFSFSLNPNGSSGNLLQLKGECIRGRTVIFKKEKEKNKKLQTSVSKEK